MPIAARQQFSGAAAQDHSPSIQHVALGRIVERDGDVLLGEAGDQARGDLNGFGIHADNRGKMLKVG
ncbi:hypothetical protein [Pseudomonas sp. 1152_12]|uniref:hypothetical protein n=1 Tax=Pseudomonas sp. 1152_12 TaxID=2604455 RepID=UPI0040639B1A